MLEYITIKEADLKPCPFCGSTNIAYYDRGCNDFTIFCVECEAKMTAKYKCRECYSLTFDKARDTCNYGRNQAVKSAIVRWCRRVDNVYARQEREKGVRND